MKKLLLLLIVIGFGNWAMAQQTQKNLKKIKIDHFFSCQLDQLMDTLTMAVSLEHCF